jgi:hypothetical protein
MSRDPPRWGLAIISATGDMHPVLHQGSDYEDIPDHRALHPDVDEFISCETEL